MSDEVEQLKEEVSLLRRTLRLHIAAVRRCNWREITKDDIDKWIRCAKDCKVEDPYKEN